MKRFLTLLLTALLALTAVFAFAACGDEGENNNNEPDNPGTSEVTGMTKWSEDLPILTFPAAAEKVDWIDTTDMNNELKLMLSSLKAVVNSTQPRIYTVEADTDSVNWLESLGYAAEDLTEHTSAVSLAVKYKDEIKGAVIWDVEVPDTVNLASTYAGIEGDVLVCSPMVYAVLAENGMELEIVRDFREDNFTGKEDVYQYLYDNLWDQCTHKILTNLSYETPGYVRDYAIAAKSAVIWLSSGTTGDDTALIRKFLGDMEDGESALMGWFPEGDEGTFVSLASEYGVMVWASDIAENLTFYASATEVTPAPLAEVPTAVENKVYVALIVSDGDNLQYHQHRMRTLWDSYNNGAYADKFPLTWTFSPAAYAIQPQIMNYYTKNAGDNNCFMTGPSGVAYVYPRDWTDRNAVNKFYELTNKYCKLTGITVVNNWMGQGSYSSLTSEEIAAFGEYYTDLLAVYDQQGTGSNEGDGSVNSNGLLVDNLTWNYTQTGESWDSYRYYIDEALDDLTSTQTPQFVTIQENPWKGTGMLDDLYRLYDEWKDNEDVVFVRMDELAMLQRLANGMSATR